MMNLLKKGFTLIELLVVIAIIGILTAVVTTNLVGARERARDARRKGDLQAIGQALRIYYTDYQTYPTSTGGAINGCDPSHVSACSWGSSFSTASSTYAGLLPVDPISTSAAPVSYFYHYGSSGNSFALIAKLENESDPDISASQTRCGNIYSGTITGYTKDVNHDYVVCAE